jgi:plastocyanin
MQPPGAKVHKPVPATPPYAPFEPEQVAQSESAANINADAASRAEISPGNTLGVGGSMPKSSPVFGGTNSTTPSKPANAGRTVVEITGDRAATLSRQQVNIRVGETVEWKNSSARVHEIIANPAKPEATSQPILPAGAKPFDSGLVRPNHSFVHRFEVPGTYRYLCDVNDSQPVEGEVIVAP